MLTQPVEGMTDDVTTYRVLVTCGFFEPGFRAGGPIRSIASLLDSLPHNVEATLVTSDRDLGSAEPFPGLSGRWAERGSSRIYYLRVSSITQWLRLLSDLRKSSFDLLYANSLWSPRSTLVPTLAAYARLIKCDRIVVAPRGELAAGALSQKTLKKKIFLSPWGWLLRRMRVDWHATAEHEEADIKRALPWARTFLNSDQASLPPDPIPPKRSESKTARLVHISRVSPAKNLDVVLRALRRVAVPLELDIYGPIEDQRLWSDCRSLIAAMPPNITVTYRGELHPNDVRETFNRYEGFVLPTRGENFGHVIAEALSASCPVICTDRTPWTHVLQQGGGVVLGSPIEDSLVSELTKIAESSSDQRMEWRLRAGSAYQIWRHHTAEQHIFDLIRRN